MIVFEPGLNEDEPAYRELEFANYARQLGFLQSAVTAALRTNRSFLSQTVIKALNYHALACLHSYAGEYRPHAVTVGVYSPPEHYRVADLMDDVVNSVNHAWMQTDPIDLSAQVLWRLNWVHPFVNGNGRTARAACYFVLCVKSGGWLSGTKLLPVLLSQNRKRYVAALQVADTGQFNDLRVLITDLLREQASS